MAIQIYGILNVILAIIFALGAPEHHSKEDSIAFPGALGFGAGSQGGRYGAILFVTNLNDSGPGSLRSACSQLGRRTVLFRVNGIIELTKDIIIKNPYITIDGISAPDKGIVVKGSGIIIRTSEVILRNLRIRPGRNAGLEKDGIGIIADGPVSNIIIDHCSIEWSTDENIGINGRDGGISNVTIQNCIIAEAILDHSMGLLANKHVDEQGINEIAIINNFFAHNHERNPMFGSQTSGVVSGNLAYNWGVKGSEYHSDVRADVYRNTWIPGQNTRNVNRSIEVRGNPNLYLSENYLIFEELKKEITFPDSVIKLRKEPIYPIIEENYSMPDHVGAMPRDITDERIVNSYKNRNGSQIRDENEVGGYSGFTRGVGILDKDNDGMDDNWEEEIGLDSGDAGDSWLSPSDSSFTYLEIFLNYQLQKKSIEL